MEKKFFFPPSFRLLNHSDFAHISNKGCKVITPLFIVLYLKSELPVSRLGITVSRKIGNAVLRNRIKRLFREFFRRNKDKLSQCYDISIIARKNIIHVDSKKLNVSLSKIIDDEFLKQNF